MAKRQQNFRRVILASILLVALMLFILASLALPYGDGWMKWTVCGLLSLLFALLFVHDRPARQ